MSESKHTAGPWISEGNLVGPAIQEDSQAFGMLFPIVASVERDDCPRSYEANKALIKAAPELLAALEAVVSVADRATVEFDMARAAIAKAKGETK